jgi:flagellar hook-associated protein 2
MAVSSTSSSTSSAIFTASGLASGMDTNSIVDQLVALESQPITLVQQQQTAIKTQISTISSLVSRLSALQSAADDLGSNGVFATKATSTNTAFTATPGTGAIPGRYSVGVEQLAQAAKWRSTGFASTDTVAGGTLTLTVQGKTYDPITLADQTSLADVAYAIRKSGAPVSAVVLNDGTSSYLSVTALDTGYPLDKTAADALGIGFAPTTQDANGNPITPVGKDPGFALLPGQGAQNAQVVIDGLKFTRQSNVITDALPGTTLSLTKAAPGTTEDLVINTDTDTTQARLQKFVDAYNSVMSLVHSQLAVTQSTDRSTSLVGVSSVRSLQGQLQSVMIAQVAGLANVRTLADLGLKSSKDDGSLSIDATTLQGALARDPSALNALFSTAGGGITKLVDDLVDQNTRSGDGALTISQDSLNSRVSQMSDEIDTMQRRVDSYRQTLLAQFTAMETTVSGLKTMGNFLTSWAGQNTKSGG